MTEAATGSAKEPASRPRVSSTGSPASKGSSQMQDGGSKKQQDRLVTPEGSSLTQQASNASSAQGMVVMALDPTGPDLEADKHTKVKEAREPLLLEPSEADSLRAGEKSQGPKEETGFHTILFSHAARLVVLFFHGLSVLFASRDLKTLDKDSWGWLFVPIWLGNFLCICLLIWSVRASCPYIRRCQGAGRVRLGIYPSILTDIFPTIFLNIVSVIVMLLLTSGEWTLKQYLATDNSRRLTESTVFLIIVCLFTTCVGSLLTHNSPLYLSLASAVFVALVTYLWVRNDGPEARAWTLVPFLIAVLVIFLSTFYRLVSHVRLMGSLEVILRLVEVATLGSLFWALQSMMGKLRDDKLKEASMEGMVVGGAMCLIALLRVFLCYWETVDGTFEDRVIQAMALPAEGEFEDEEAVIEEIQLQERQPGPTEGTRGPPEVKVDGNKEKPTAQANGTDVQSVAV